MNGLLHLALNASFLVQLVMIILIGLSVWSWVIIFVKRKELKNVLIHNHYPQLSEQWKKLCEHYELQILERIFYFLISFLHKLSMQYR